MLKKYIHLILLLAILIISFSIRYSNPSSLSALYSGDAVQYSLSAYNLYHHHIYGIKYAGQYYPAMYPYGYPLLIIPFYIIFGSQPYNAVYSSLFFSLLSIVFAYLIGKELGSRLTGIIGALFLALCPLHILRSKLIMSEVSSGFFALLICWLLLRVIAPYSKKQIILLLILGLVTGFSVSVHLTNCLIIPPILISLLIGRKSSHWSILKKATIILFGIFLALLPLFIYQFHTFGSPLRTGYYIWDPDFFGKEFKAFSLKFFAQPHHNYKRGNFQVYLTAIAGLDKHFYPATMVPLLLAAVLFLLSKKRERHKQMIFLIFSSIFVSLLLIYHSFYFWQAGQRFLLMGTTFLMIFAGWGITSLVDKGSFKSLTKEFIFNLTIISLFLMTIIQMVVWDYSLPKIKPWISMREYNIIQYINRYIQNNAVIISHFPPAIAEHYLTEHTADKRVFIRLSLTLYLSRIATNKVKPIRYDRTKKYSFLFRPGGTLNPKTYNFIRECLKKGVPVYLVHLPDNPDSKRLFPHIKRYFNLIEQKGDSGLFRLYPKDW